MFITLSVVTALILSSAVFSATLATIRQKVDINVYFVPTASEEDVLAIQKNLEKTPGVAEVEYVSKEAVLEAFKKRHENDSTILQSLEEVSDNPFGPTLNVRAVRPDQYASIANYLKDQNLLSDAGIPIIDKINYYDNQVAIDKLTKIMNISERAGYILMIVLIGISVVITFNTIRLAIYISREEISVMRLVGASNKYIRGPFVIVGMLYGACAGIAALAAFYPLTVWLGRTGSELFIGIDVHTYYISNFVQICLLIVGSGIVLGALSSYLAVRKYLTK